MAITLTESQLGTLEGLWTGMLRAVAHGLSDDRDLSIVVLGLGVAFILEKR